MRSGYVIPAEAGIQKAIETLDARLRGHDGRTIHFHS